MSFRNFTRRIFPSRNRNRDIVPVNMDVDPENIELVMVNPDLVDHSQEAAVASLVPSNREYTRLPSRIDVQPVIERRGTRRRFPNVYRVLRSLIPSNSASVLATTPNNTIYDPDRMYEGDLEEARQRSLQPQSHQLPDPDQDHRELQEAIQANYDSLNQPPRVQPRVKPYNPYNARLPEAIQRSLQPQSHQLQDPDQEDIELQRAIQASYDIRNQRQRVQPRVKPYNARLPSLLNSGGKNKKTKRTTKKQQKTKKAKRTRRRRNKSKK